MVNAKYLQSAMAYARALVLLILTGFLDFCSVRSQFAAADEPCWSRVIRWYRVDSGVGGCSYGSEGDGTSRLVTRQGARAFVNG